MRAGWILPSWTSFSSVMRAASRRTGSKQESTTASGVSSMMMLTPVAASNARMLRPSRPMIRPFMSSLGSEKTLTLDSAVCSDATRWIAIVTIFRARSSPSSRARCSISRTCAIAPRFASSTTWEASMLPGLGGRHPRDPLELRLVLVGRLLELLPHERELVLPLLQLRGSPVDPLAALAEVGLGLGDTAFEASDLLAAVLEVLLGLAPHPRGFVLGFLEPLGPRLGGLLFGIQEELLRLCFGGARVGRSDRVPDDESRDAPDHEAEEAGDDGVHRSSRCLGRGISVPDQGATEEASGS